MDYFNEDEREQQQAFAGKRDRFFGPIIRGLAATPVTPNQLTFIGIAFLLAGCAFGTDVPWAASVFLPLYCLMDGLDGPLARHRDTASKGGSLLDIIADQLGVVFVPAAAVYHLGADGAASTLFASFYVAFITVVIVANETGVKIPKFLRVKYVMYVVYCLCIIFNIDYMTHFLAIFSAYYVVMFALVVRALYRQMEAQ